MVGRKRVAMKKIRAITCKNTDKREAKCGDGRGQRATGEVLRGTL